MEDPSLLSRETLPGLKQLIDNYPYFHTARMLYLKNLAAVNDIHFGSELKKMAIYIPDRKKLFAFIEGIQRGFGNETEKETLEEQSDTFSLIDNFLSSHSELSDIASSDPSILFRPSASSDYLYWAVSTQPDAEFSDEEASHQLQHHDLIDSFLQEDKQRTPGSGFKFDDNDDEYVSLDYLEDMENKNDKQKTGDDDSYFTETLARIYIKQKRYEKALQIIKNLSLKYPEKNVYFADQIRFLEKLIINSKK
ncbi:MULTISPECIES: hypothetical protein [unclassified Parabacteroides]|nr:MULTISPECIES: hypothetical protein [unclassified Parabacteroides]